MIWYCKYCNKFWNCVAKKWTFQTWISITLSYAWKIHFKKKTNLIYRYHVNFNARMFSCHGNFHIIQMSLFHLENGNLELIVIVSDRYKEYTMIQAVDSYEEHKSSMSIECDEICVRKAHHIMVWYCIDSIDCASKIVSKAKMPSGNWRVIEPGTDV